MESFTNFERVPIDLAEIPSWCVSIDPEKRPYRAYWPTIPASTTLSTSWSAFITAWQCCDDGAANWAGYVLTEADGIMVVDLDHCIEADGSPNDLAMECIWRWEGAYCETSKSGNGLHFFFKGSIPAAIAGDKAEVYDRERYVVITGNSTRDPYLPLTEFPSEDYAWIEARAGKRKNVGNGKAGSGESASIVWEGLVPHLPPIDSHRHNALVSFAGTLANAGWPASRLRAAVIAEDERSCRPPLGKKEAERIANWAIKKQDS